MKFLLDTNAVIALFAGEPALLRLMWQHEPGDFGLSTIVAHELYYGAQRSTRVADNLGRVDGVLFATVDFTLEDARCAGKVRAELANAGQPIGPYDVLIAGQALSRGLVLVTRNAREFSRVSSLRIESWGD